MSYQLIFRPKATAPICPKNLRNQLLAAGLKARPDSTPPGLLCDGCALFEIVADALVPPGVGVLVKIPFRREFFDFTLELLNLERISCIINAELIDGEEVLVHSGKEGLVSLFALHARYERASDRTPAIADLAVP